MNKRIVRDSLILFAITLISGLLLGLVYDITKAPIAASEEKAKQEAYKAVFEDAQTFEVDPNATPEKAAEVLGSAGITTSTIEEVLVAKDASAQPLGYVMKITNSEGYGGNISLSVGIKTDGTVNGYEILTINETAGLGMKAKDAAFKDQYKNKKVDQYEVTKTGAAEENQIDAISGATITTKAVTNGVNAGITYFKSLVGGGADE